MYTHIINSQKSRVILGQNIICTPLIIELCTSPTVILCDEHLEAIMGKLLKNYLHEHCIEVYLFSFKPGEFSKTREMKEKIENHMLAHGLGKDTTLLALGGGVTTDLGGFIAATYCRGIRFISVPTSLMAMVDAAIGGKNGVNTPYGKNMIGSFYFPETIVIDFEMLKTLKKSEHHQGFVEVIKIALIQDASLFIALEQGYEHLSKSAFMEIIKRAIDLKIQVVEQDAKETLGLRRILNLGHTVAHALEAYFHYKISHGEAVAKGIIAECFMAKQLKLLSQHDFHRIVRCLLPYTFKHKFHLGQVLEKMRNDKKALLKTPRFVMLEKIGAVHAMDGQYCMHVMSEIVLEALQFIRELK